jgi:uncharacterized membrane protein
MTSKNNPAAPVSGAPSPIPSAPVSQAGDTRAALIYFTGGITGLLGSHKHDPEVRYQSFHALFTALAFLALHAVLGMLGGTFLVLQALTDLAAGIFGLLQTYRAYQGIPIAIPVISAMARKHAEPDDTGNNRVM